MSTISQCNQKKPSMNTFINKLNIGEDRIVEIENKSEEKNPE